MQIVYRKTIREQIVQAILTAPTQNKEIEEIILSRSERVRLLRELGEDVCFIPWALYDGQKVCTLDGVQIRVLENE